MGFQPCDFWIPADAGMTEMSVDSMATNFNLDNLLSGNRRALAKAITLVESKLDAHREQAQGILEQVLPHSGNSIRIGITGVPGVGKSTFIEAFGSLLPISLLPAFIPSFFLPFSTSIFLIPSLFFLAFLLHTFLVLFLFSLFPPFL